MLRCLLLLPVVAAALRVRGLQVVRRDLARRLPARVLAGLSPARIAWVVHTAAHHHFMPITCLPRAVLLERALVCAGHTGAELRIGVRRGDAPLAAHAWVEFQGAPLGEDALVGERYAAFAGLPGPEAGSPP